MAESVLPTLLPLIIQKLASAPLEKPAREMGINSDLQKLKASLSHIRDLLDDASKKEITARSVKRWLNRLQDLAYDIDDILDDLQSDAMCRELAEKSEPRPSKVRKLISNLFPTFSSGVGMKVKLANLTSNLQDLEQEIHTFGLIRKSGKPINMYQKEETGLLDASAIVGREEDKEKLLHELLGNEPCDENFSIVAIVGMGGVGKTTLARLVYNESKVNDHFELKAWVCVSDEFDIFHISKVILLSVTCQNSKETDLNMLQDALRMQFTGKRFLLVLDDVWCENRDEWDSLVKPFHAGARGSKIIITTRKERLLNELRHNHRNHLAMLSHDDALSLFALHAFGVDNFDSHQKLKPYGEHIVNKCGSLPLALKTLGRLLRTKVYTEWEEVLNSEIWTVGERGDILPALRLSYNDLSAVLKQLFAYCSLFPKGYLFYREELVLLWMAEGFLHPPSLTTSMERWGHECFDQLLSRSFFQRAPNEEQMYVMHDLLNDLATSVAGDFILRLDGGVKKEVMKDRLERLRHLSFVCEKYTTSEKFKAFKGADKLRSFLVLSSEVKSSWTRFYVSNSILPSMVRQLPLLRVLSLSYLSVSELPESIGSLKHLRYLNLSHTKIEHLSEHVCSLCNLQTLIISGCNITELPKSFLKLKSLLHFDIRDTKLLNKIPEGISALESLRIVASKIVIEGDYVFAVTGLKRLTDLQGNLSIEGLDKVKKLVHVMDVDLSQKRLSELELKWNHKYDGSRTESVEKEVLKVLKPCNDSLIRLAIGYYGASEFPRWVGHPSFHLLTDIKLYGCEKCASLPPLEQLPSLKKLNIESMQRLEVWSSNTDFPFLEELHIEHCPKLVEVSVKALPSLRVLDLKKCGDGVLRSLVQVASSSLTSLEIEHISGLTCEVWRGVVEHLGALEVLKIEWCNEIRYLWGSEAEASKVLAKLRSLTVSDCSNMVSLGEKEDEENSINECNLHLTSLRTLRVWDCKNMEHFSCPNRIEELDIRGCDSITSISYPTVRGGPNLKSLRIHYCKKLVLEKDKFAGGEKDATLLINNTDMPLLEALTISGVKNLQSLVKLRSFTRLTSLRINDCPNIKSFPDHELQNFSVLKHLVITNCGGMDASFPRGFWPPKLQELRIGNLKKPVLEWGPQNFPTSLVELWLTGGSAEEDVSSWGDLSHILPLSLTSLGIEGFEELESVSMGLQHFTFLQNLYFFDCPNMRGLPEKALFLPSILSLWIKGCPILTGGCSKSGSYWPLISHIPRIEIYP